MSLFIITRLELQVSSQKKMSFNIGFSTNFRAVGVNGEVQKRFMAAKLKIWVLTLSPDFIHYNMGLHIKFSSTSKSHLPDELKRVRIRKFISGDLLESPSVLNFCEVRY
ncbi:hypothetical protein TNIN_104921 [Trichonephila inaurata madagascariensis]|uniref:Uncharacterized protein n=1 Tax=Trichonephila inaurata madagascariensis TaxID=2747483 RepID=A0A8X6YSQ9_9ARAC|nr:hypothetical protein TNIN_104921 [Trichonephila inaurata madagascariensis]